MDSSTPWTCPLQTWSRCKNRQGKARFCAVNGNMSSNWIESLPAHRLGPGRRRSGAVMPGSRNLHQGAEGPHPRLANTCTAGDQCLPGSIAVCSTGGSSHCPPCTDNCLNYFLFSIFQFVPRCTDSHLYCIPLSFLSALLTVYSVFGPRPCLH